MKDGDRPNQSITTTNQSGGQNIIAGGDVHLGPKRRLITPTQEAAILSALAGVPAGKVEISVTESDLEAVAFARQIESLLKKAGNQVHVRLMMMMSGPMGAPVGLGLTIKNERAVPPHAQAIGNALGAVGLTQGGSTNPDRDKDTLYITVGARGQNRRGGQRMSMPDSNSESPHNVAKRGSLGGQNNKGLDSTFSCPLREFFGVRH